MVWLLGRRQDSARKLFVLCTVGAGAVCEWGDVLVSGNRNSRSNK
jgi:hypothetical protein